jgi:hypothetical protein
LLELAKPFVGVGASHQRQCMPGIEPDRLTVVGDSAPIVAFSGPLVTATEERSDPGRIGEDRLTIVLDRTVYVVLVRTSAAAILIEACEIRALERARLDETAAGDNGRARRILVVRAVRLVVRVRGRTSDA